MAEHAASRATRTGFAARAACPAAAGGATATTGTA
jgi:hypothetical protein